MVTPFSLFTFKMEQFIKMLNEFQVLTIFGKSSILSVWKGSEYDSAMKKHLSAASKLKLYHTSCLVELKG